MGRAIVFEAVREGYGIDQLKAPMTVGQLKEFLEHFDDDELVILSHDRGYTYGSLSANVTIHEENEDGDWEETDWVCLSLA